MILSLAQARRVYQFFMDGLQIPPSVTFFFFFFDYVKSLEMKHMLLFGSISLHEEINH